MRTAGGLLLALLLAACVQARSAPVRWEVASRDRTPREIEVVAVWDDLSERIPGREEDGRITHYVEVDILHAERASEAATWPYDEHATGRPPPRPGTRLVVSPADFLHPAGDLLRRRPAR